MSCSTSAQSCPIFVDLKMSMYHGDLQIHHHRKKYIAVIVLFDPVPLYSVWLLLLLFPFNSELIFNIRSMFSLLLMKYFEVWKFVWQDLCRLECFCSSITLISLFQIELKENQFKTQHRCMPASKRVIASPKVYVCSVWICLTLHAIPHMSSLAVSHIPSSLNAYYVLLISSSSVLEIYNFDLFQQQRSVINYIIYT